MMLWPTRDDFQTTPSIPTDLNPKRSISCWSVWLTCSLDEPRVSVVWDDGNGQIPQVEFERARNDVDVFIGLPRDVCLLTVCEDGAMEKEVQISADAGARRIFWKAGRFKIKRCFHPDFSLCHACFLVPPWPTCAGRVNIAVLWVGMTICHGWTPPWQSA